jgi:hypothetical protein
MDLLQMFRRPLAGLAGAVAVMLLASAAAQAFTLEDQGTASGGAAAKFSDPADRVKSGMTATAATRPGSRAATPRCNSAGAARSTSATMRTAISARTL